jgi:hypothetical protein
LSSIRQREIILAVQDGQDMPAVAEGERFRGIDEDDSFINDSDDEIIPSDDDELDLGDSALTRANAVTLSKAEMRMSQIQAGLLNLDINVTEHLAKEVMVSYRNRLVQELAALTPVVSGVEKPLKVEHIIKLVNFFSSDLFGHKAMVRVTGLIKHYQAAGEEVDRGLYARAHNLSRDSSIPKVFRDCFESIGRCASLKEKETDVVRGFKLNIQLLELRTNYNTLVEKLSQKSRRVIAALEKANVPTGRGHDCANQIKVYMNQKLQLGKNQLTNLLTQATMVAILVNEYGDGIVPLLPGNTGR